MRTPDVGRVRRAKALRQALSPPELKLWLELRAASTGRCPFRKQHAIGPYVLDFYCARARLAVEVDGYAHGTGDRPQRDARKDAWLAGQGIEVLRVSATRVLGDPGEVAWELLLRVSGRGDI